MQPKIGEIITVGNVKYITELAVNSYKQCNECHLLNKPCLDIVCASVDRKDGQSVIFKEIKEMEVKIQIPDNCELIKDGDTYIVKEKKQNPPRSWEEFCERCPKKRGTAFIRSTSEIFVFDIISIRDEKKDKNVCSSKEEAEAFLALMQLRQLRKAWVGDWEPYPFKSYSAISTIVNDGKIVVWEFNNTLKPISFPTKEMAQDFLNCFKDLCEKAKILL